MGPDTAGFENHLRFSLNVTGRLEMHGSRLFWAPHFVHIPIKKYQRIFLGTSWRKHIDQRIVSLSPYDVGFGSRLGVFDGDAAAFAGTAAAGIRDKLLVLDVVGGANVGYARRWSEIDITNSQLTPKHRLHSYG